jgi:hypothetical protein
MRSSKASPDSDACSNLSEQSVLARCAGHEPSSIRPVRISAPCGTFGMYRVHAGSGVGQNAAVCSDVGPSLDSSSLYMSASGHNVCIWKCLVRWRFVSLTLPHSSHPSGEALIPRAVLLLSLPFALRFLHLVALDTLLLALSIIHAPL